MEPIWKMPGSATVIIIASSNVVKPDDYILSACASKVYGSALVCVCVAFRLLCSFLRIIKVHFFRILVMITWILIRGFAK